MCCMADDAEILALRALVEYIRVLRERTRIAADTLEAILQRKDETWRK